MPFHRHRRFGPAGRNRILGQSHHDPGRNALTPQTRSNSRVIIPALAAAASPFLMPAPAVAQPAEIQLTGVVRDFRAYGDPGGHPTMERPNIPDPLKPRWIIGNLVESSLGPDRRLLPHGAADQ